MLITKIDYEYEPANPTINIFRVTPYCIYKDWGIVYKLSSD